MRTFTAACLAASATAFDVKEVPEFVAGFLFGMTGDNHLTEIEACYQGGEKILSDTKLALSDFKSGHFFKGIKEAGTVWNELGSSMHTCTGISDDLAAVEAWAKIFTEPLKLSKTVAKSWLFHGSDIKADIAKEESDWSSKHYFSAGKDVADALTLAVGPVHPEMYQASNGLPDIKGPVEFVAGLVEGIIQENHLDTIQTCVTDVDTIVPQVEELIGDIKGGHKIKAAALAKKIVGELPNTLSTCEAMGPQLKQLEQWATVFENPKTVVEDITKAMVLHHKQIEADISTVKTDWNAGQYYQSGKAAGDILYIAVGPVPQPSSNYKFDLMAVPDLLAGFVYGMVGENHLTEM